MTMKETMWFKDKPSPSSSYSQKKKNYLQIAKHLHSSRIEIQLQTKEDNKHMCKAERLEPF